MERLINYGGTTHSFPADATDAEIESALEAWEAGNKQTGTPAGSPRVSTLEERQEQRAALEGKLATLKRQIQELEEARGAVQMQDYSQIDASIAGLRNEQKALEEQIKRTGVGTTGRNIGSAAGSVLGGIGGAVLGSMAGPKGTVAGGVAGSAAGAGAGSALGTMLDIRRAQPITEEEASNLILRNAVEDVIWDVAGSAIFVVGGKALKVALNPGVRERLGRLLQTEKVGKRVGVATEKRLAASEAMFDPASAIPGKEAGREAADAAARERAVVELSERGRGFVPTPGQVRGRATGAERVARSLQADKFVEQGEAMERAAGAMREEVVRPYGQPSRPELGALVLRQADKVEKAVKNRTKPVFEAAKRVGVEVDFAPVVQRIEAALVEDAASAGASLKPAERSHLEMLLRNLTRQQDDIVEILGPDGKPLAQDAGIRLSAQGAFDFISGNKSKLRDVGALDVPSRQYEKIIGEMNDLADAQALGAIEGIGGKTLRDALLKAREEYRGMMTGIYDGAVQQSLKRNPEDVGRLFWQRGNVTEVKQLQNLIQMGIRERTMDPEQAQALNEAMLRGFLAEAVPDIQSAAKWSDTLGKDVLKRDTYEALKSAPGMEKLDDGMRVLEQAAQMALTKNADLAFTGSGMISNLPARIAIGISLGFIGPKAVALFAGVEVWARMMATALARKDVGAFRNMQLVLRAASTDNPKMISAARPAAVALTKWIKDLGDPELEAQVDFGEGQQQEQE